MELRGTSRCVFVFERNLWSSSHCRKTRRFAWIYRAKVLAGNVERNVEDRTVMLAEKKEKKKKGEEEKYEQETQRYLPPPTSLILRAILFFYNLFASFPLSLFSSFSFPLPISPFHLLLLPTLLLRALFTSRNKTFGLFPIPFSFVNVPFLI